MVPTRATCPRGYKESIMRQKLKRFIRENRAVSALEYALLVSIVAVGLGVALVTFSGVITDKINDASTQVKNLGGGGTPPATPAP